MLLYRLILQASMKINHHTLLNFQKKIKDYLVRLNEREFTIFILFFIVAFGWWFLRNGQIIHNTELSIPIHYKELPSNITITNQLPSSLQVILKDKGRDLYKYRIHRSRLMLEIDLSAWKTPKGISFIPTDFYKDILSKKLNAGTQILRINPDSIPVYFVEKEKKILPVHLRSNIRLAPQRIMTKEPLLSQQTISVLAPTAILDSLSYIETELLELTDLNDSMIVKVALKPIHGVQFEQDHIDVILPVERYTEAYLEIPVSGIHFPEDMQLMSFPGKVNVSFLVSESDYSHIKPEDFQVGIDYNDIIHSTNDLFTLQLLQAPKNVRRVLLQPEKVECLIKRK